MHNKYLVLFAYGDNKFQPYSNLVEAEAFAFNLLKNDIESIILERTDLNTWRRVD